MGCLPPPAGWLYFLSCACLSSLRTGSLPRAGLSDTHSAKNTKGHLWEISCNHPDQRWSPRGDGGIPRMCSCAHFLKMTLIYLFIFTIIPSYWIFIADLFCACPSSGCHHLQNEHHYWHLVCSSCNYTDSSCLISCQYLNKKTTIHSQGKHDYPSASTPDEKRYSQELPDPWKLL